MSNFITEVYSANTHADRDGSGHCGIESLLLKSLPFNAS